MDKSAFTDVDRRTFLKTTGATIVAAANAGCARLNGAATHLPRGGHHRSKREPILFNKSEELLLDSTVLPGEGWEVNESVEADILDAGSVLQYQFEEGETLDGDQGNTWIVSSYAGGRPDEDKAADLYEEFYTRLSDQVGEARIMKFDLATEAAIAGYDGTTAAVFRDVNCVGSIQFQDCSLQTCLSDVARTKRFARTKQHSWRGGNDTE